MPWTNLCKSKFVHLKQFTLGCYHFTKDPKKMQNNIGTIMTAVAGNVGVMLTTQVAENIPSPEEVQTIGQLLIQLVIGIVTIWKLIKKPKDK